jgi:N-acetylneuraminic acid mutarotase
MAAARSGHTATVLPDGRVLVAGGNTLASAELYDPDSGQWNATGSMAAARSGHTANLLPDGRVLVAGGNALARAELYDPSTGFWTATGNMVVPRSGHTATLLSDGTVLVAGGYFGSIASSYSGLPSAELYDPSTGSWTEIGNLTEARSEHTATRLPDGTVLVAGGMASSAGPVLASTELYDPSTRSWTASRNMDGVRQGHAATLLSDGTVLVVGGFGDTGSGSGLLASAALYDPSTETWTATGSLAAGRSDPTAILLSNGTVLVVGGYDSRIFPFSPVASPAELFDPSSGTWTAATRMIEARTFQTATLLSDGTVLVAGGGGGGAPPGGPILASAELYDPGSGT